MIDKIIEAYGQFSDGLVSEVRYFCREDRSFIEITILCLNKICFAGVVDHKNKDCYEHIKLSFSDIY